MKNVYKHIVANPETACWIYTGAVATDGYPVIARGKNTNIKAHRYVFEHEHRKLKDGEVVRHTCDNPLCINPAHLLAGTPADNMNDRRERARTHKHVSDIEIEAIEMLRIKQGKTYKEIASILNINIKRVEYVCNKYIY